MSHFTLTELDALNPESLDLGQLRLLLDAGVQDLKTTFWDRDEEIEDWAAGGWKGRAELMRVYGHAEDGDAEKITDLMAFDKLYKAFARAEAKELNRQLATRLCA